MTKNLNIDFFILQNVSGRNTINFYRSLGKFVVGMFHGLYVSSMFHGKVSPYKTWINFDNLDSKMVVVNKAIAEVEPGNFSNKVFPLDNRSFYKPKK